MTRRPLLACDLETQGLSAAWDKSCRVHSVGFCEVGGEPFLVDIDDSAQLQKLINENTLVFCNALFDVSVLATNGYLVNDYHCLSVLHYNLDGASSSDNHSLEGLSQRYLGKGKFPTFKDWSVFTPEMRQYALQDLRLTSELIPLILDGAESKPGWSCYVNIDLPYINILSEMLRTGCLVNSDTLAELVPVYEEAIAEIEQRHTAIYGYERGKYHSTATVTAKMINGKIVKETSRMRCDIVPKSLTGDSRQRILRQYHPAVAAAMPLTETGKIQTDKAALYSVAHLVPCAQLWLDHAEKSTQLNTFLLPLIKLAQTGRVHTSLHQYNTRTGRLSSSNPNLQNIPANGEKGAEVRRAFVAKPGYKIVVGDLDRIELVVFGFLNQMLQDNSAIANRVNSGDVHESNRLAWGVKREIAKRVIFLLIYGGSVNRMVASCGMEPTAASNAYAQINADINLVNYQKIMTKLFVDGGGKMANYFRRILSIPEVLSSDRTVKSSGVRKAGNYCVQSTAGDVFKILQLRAYAALLKSDLPKEAWAQLLVVHDEVIYEVKEEFVEQFVAIAQPCYNDDKIFQGVTTVSLKFGVGDNWYDAKKGG